MKTKIKKLIKNLMKMKTKINKNLKIGIFMVKIKYLFFYRIYFMEILENKAKIMYNIQI